MKPLLTALIALASVAGCAQPKITATIPQVEWKKQTDSLKTIFSSQIAAAEKRLQQALAETNAGFLKKLSQAIDTLPLIATMIQPSGVVDSTNKVFQLLDKIETGSETVYADGAVLAKPNDYRITLDGKITTVVAPKRWIRVSFLRK